METPTYDKLKNAIKTIIGDDRFVFFFIEYLKFVRTAITENFYSKVMGDFIFQLFVMWACQSCSTQSNGKYEQNPRVEVATLVMSVNYAA